jgi:hypothetical protein
MTIVEFPLKPNQAPVKFKFTIPSTRRMELAAGSGVDMLRLRGQSIYAIVLMTCYALQWSDRTMTEDKAADLIEKFKEAGGKIEELSEALVKALNESGVYGQPKVESGDEPDPTTTTEDQTTA